MDVKKKRELAELMVGLIDADQLTREDMEDVFAHCRTLWDMREMQRQQSAIHEEVKRRDRALERALRLQLGIKQTGTGRWAVRSQSRAMAHQVVYQRENQPPWWCSCEARSYCAHIARAQFEAGVFRAERDRLLLAAEKLV